MSSKRRVTFCAVVALALSIWSIQCGKSNTRDNEAAAEFVSPDLDKIESVLRDFCRRHWEQYRVQLKSNEAVAFEGPKKQVVKDKLWVIGKWTIRRSNEGFSAEYPMELEKTGGRTTNLALLVTLGYAEGTLTVLDHHCEMRVEGELAPELVNPDLDEMEALLRTFCQQHEKELGKWDIEETVLFEGPKKEIRKGAFWVRGKWMIGNSAEGFEAVYTRKLFESETELEEIRLAVKIVYREGKLVVSDHSIRQMKYYKDQ